MPPTRAIMYHVPSERTQWRNKRSFVKAEGMEGEINERLRRGLRQKDRKKVKTFTVPEERTEQEDVEAILKRFVFKDIGCNLNLFENISC